MTTSEDLCTPQFPRSSNYNPAWMLASASGGANSLWLTEWLTLGLDLQPGMNVLDLGCGRAASSVLLAREYGVTMWAADLWFNLQLSIPWRSLFVSQRIDGVHVRRSAGGIEAEE